MNRTVTGLQSDMTDCEYYSPCTGECYKKPEHCPGWTKYGRCDGDCPLKPDIDEELRLDYDIWY